jgi:hypothetical protein
VLIDLRLISLLQENGFLTQRYAKVNAEVRGEFVVIEVCSTQSIELLFIPNDRL